MTEIFNHKYQKQIRRKLRKQEILAEKILWGKLRNKQQKYKFRRQFGIGNFIFDFYCPKLKLAVEIDGATHSSRKEIDSDKRKEKFLAHLGIVIKRYTNTDVYESLYSVLEDIYNNCLNRERELKDKNSFFHVTSPYPLLRKERG